MSESVRANVGMHAVPQLGALSPGESGCRFKCSVTGSRWCNGAALPWVFGEQTLC